MLAMSEIRTHIILNKLLLNFNADKLYVFIVTRLPPRTNGRVTCFTNRGKSCWNQRQREFRRLSQTFTEMLAEIHMSEKIHTNMRKSTTVSTKEWNFCCETWWSDEVEVTINGRSCECIKSGGVRTICLFVVIQCRIDMVIECICELIQINFHSIREQDLEKFALRQRPSQIWDFQ